jgi:hypothetical protein
MWATKESDTSKSYALSAAGGLCQANGPQIFQDTQDPCRRHYLAADLAVAVESNDLSWQRWSSQMELAEAEARLGLTFPDRHRRAMLDAADPIHDATDFLVLASPYELLRLIDVNVFLHAPDQWNRWPDFLVAFASNGCADYFAYDLRSQPPRIIYMDPDRTVEENLTAEDKLEYESFERWYASRLSQ